MDVVPGVVILFVLLVVLVVVLLGVWQYKREQERRRVLAAFAASRGWTYTPRDDGWVDRFEGYPFDQGHTRQARHVMTGAHDGRPCVVMEYSYKTTSSNGKSSTTVTHTFLVVGIDSGARFPLLSVTPEGVFRRMLGKVFNTDIELESEEFNREFSVFCDDRKFAYDVLHPPMMELLLRRPDLGWCFDGPWIRSYADGGLDFESMQERLDLLDGVLDNIPDFVWREVRQ